MSIVANIAIDYNPEKNEIYLLGDIVALQSHRYAWRYIRDYLSPVVGAEYITIPVGDSEPFAVIKYQFYVVKIWLFRGSKW